MAEPGVRTERFTVALTVKRVERLIKPGRHGDGGGLYLQIGKKGGRAWLLRYERGGRERWLGLGSASDFDLPEARERARKARQQLADGIDPVEAKEAERAARAAEAARAMSFKEAAGKFIADHEAGWKNKRHADQWPTTLRKHVFPILGALPVGEIDTPLVLKVIEPLWKTRTETASRVRARIEAILGWATVRGLRTGDNPARWKNHLDQVLPARGKVAPKVHHPAMPYADVPAFMAELGEREGVVAAALRFLILTAARSGQVR